ncbi:TPR-like protein [Metschnikowia bicuspidata var. bicuspidata NRRL YB-4993]|uniref:TPR-like protein n=1 Tax=Metschnikowia bicuspidata var. bicuspidata NRRL YB-4993 TaxID=869754 RepID=A0A1A0HDD3_9ASCO|nr:TPR-like protein [Metschnikowia bicuspidata var. bicuspidata NRRL YB-4993]OBA22026.1 TPR-like protein [Metschnikowia bicuspidata var. bicuspidata NRRL YB-4993]
MSLKQLLKAAKAAIDRNDPEDALDHAKEALKMDKNCYFAYIFQGKLYQLLSELGKAQSSFEKATELEPENLLGWRGWYQVAKSSDNYDTYFRVLTKYLHVQIEQDVPIADTVKDVFNYLHARDFQKDAILNETYLRAILPGTELANLLGSAMGNPAESVKKLLTLVKSREDQQVRQALAKEKLRLPRVLTAALHARLHELEWSLRKDSDISALYQIYLETSDDDELRRKYEIELLKYKYALLKIKPEKAGLLEEIKEMADDLVLLDTPDLFTWSLHLDLQDSPSIDDLDQGLLKRCIQKFKGEGLSAVLYLYVMSDMCLLDKEQFKDIYLGEKLEPEPLQEELLDGELLDSDVLETDDTHTEGLSPTEVLDLMLQGYAKCSDSMLAHRIVCSYLIFIQDYEAALEKCTTVIRHLADFQRTYGIDLCHCKESVLCLLASVYTYHEAPKNFSRALQLYNKILLDNSSNKQALIGKGLILVAKRELDSAYDLLSLVARDFPGDPRALMELGWCHVLQERYADGRGVLQSALEHVQEVSPKSFVIRADIHWRLAKSFLMEDSENDANLKSAYNFLVLSLKDSKTFAPSYTLLGILYYDHYDDKARAQKCFYKAFELDVAEITAAKYLVKDLAKKSDWEITEILCKRVVTSEKSRRILFSLLYEDPDKSWPYRVLGCSALNRQDDAKAIEWFQTALRMHAMDLECWIGLGEAYYNCGRMDAALKVFQHTVKTDPTSWVSHYMLGSAVCAIGDYASGLEALRTALTMNPDAECILNALYEQHIMYSSQLLLGGFVKRTLLVNNSAMEIIAQAAKKNPTSLSLWKSLGQCLKLVTHVQQDISDLPIDHVLGTLKTVSGIDDEHASSKAAKSLFEDGSHLEAISMLNVLAARAAIHASGQKVHKLVRSYTKYNLGLAFLDAFNVCEEANVAFRDMAIEQFKDSIKLEPANAQYWLALGNAYVSLDPLLAQHCFIKASVFDSKDFSVWSNLAALYLRYGDAELAQEAFDRATSMAPEQSMPWLGNALTAEASGDEEKSKGLSTHAYVLSNGRSALAQLCYALSVLNNRIGSSKDARDVEAAQEFSIANFAIQSFLKFQPTNETGLKLALLLSERCHTYESSIVVGEKLSEVLEKKFEKSESSAVMLEVATTKTLLARVYMGMGDYESAIENAQFTLDLVAEEETSPAVREAILSSRIVIGLSFFFNEQYNEALEEFQMILADHGLSQKAVTLTAQILHALDTPESKQAAIDQLFTFMEENGSSLLVVLTLGAISVVNDFEDYYIPIKEELESLKLQELIGDNFRQVPKLLKEISDRVSGRDGSTVWQKFAMLFPGDFNIWKNLDSHMALSSALLSESKRTAIEVSSAYAEKATRREIQRALLICADNAAARLVLMSAH